MKELVTHVFAFNPKDNGGEQLTLTTTYYDNGDGAEGIFTNQFFTLESYGNKASINICGFEITSDMLRKLANELDSIKSKY